MRMAALWAMVLLVGISVQKVILSGFFWINPKPDLMLVLAVSAGLLGGKEKGIGIGFFAGLIQDLSSGNIFGLNIFSKMAAGYLGGFMESRVFKENIFLPAIITFMATLLSGAVAFVFLYFLGYSSSFWYFFTGQFILTAICNLAIAVPAHQTVYRLIYKQKT